MQPVLLLTARTSSIEIITNYHTRDDHFYFPRTPLFESLVTEPIARTVPPPRVGDIVQETYQLFLRERDDPSAELSDEERAKIRDLLRERCEDEQSGHQFFRSIYDEEASDTNLLPPPSHSPTVSPSAIIDYWRDARRAHPTATHNFLVSAVQYYFTSILPSDYASAADLYDIVISELSTPFEDLRSTEDSIRIGTRLYDVSYAELEAAFGDVSEIDVTTLPADSELLRIPRLRELREIADAIAAAYREVGRPVTRPVLPLTPVNGIRVEEGVCG